MSGQKRATNYRLNSSLERMNMSIAGIFKFLRTRTIAAYVCALMSVLFVLACSKPDVIESHRFPSPSGELVATVEVVHNGLSFGAGAEYDEIHISSSSRVSFRHGDRDSSVAFYALSTYGKGRPPEVRWVDEHHLRVLLDPLTHPGHQLASLGGVSIDYQVREKQRNAP